LQKEHPLLLANFTEPANALTINPLLIGVGVGKFLGVQKIFARISSNMLEKFAGNNLYISSHTDQFWDELQKKSLNVILPRLSAIFIRIFRYTLPRISGILRTF